MVTTRVLVLVAVVLAAVAAPRGPVARATGDSDSAVLFVHTPAPQPGLVRGAGAMEVHALVRSPAALVSVDVTVDGEPVGPVEIGQPDANGDRAVDAAVNVAPGEHVVRVGVADEAGRRASRTWSFHAVAQNLERIAGRDRFATAAAVSAATFPRMLSARAGVVARGDEFADALAGAPLAVAVGGPLLLAYRDRLPRVTADELRRVLPPGSTVHLLGGSGALGEGVADDLRVLGFQTVRHAGPDRYATAAAVARMLPPSPQVVVASGASFADALTASPPAARDGVPVVLTAPDHLPRPVAEVLAQRDVTQATIVGGHAAVGGAVEEQLRALGSTVRRVSGRDRYATAAAVVDVFYSQPAGMSLASGHTFADALAGSVHAATLARPLLLVAARSLPWASAEVLRARRPDDVTVYGGMAAVSEHVAGAVLRARVTGTAAPRVAATTPLPFSTVSWLDEVTVRFDRQVEPQRSSVYVEVAGVEARGALVATGPSTALTWRLQDEPALPVGREYPARVVVAAAAPGGAPAHEEILFTRVVPDPVFASAGEVALSLPSRDVEMVGFHQSSSDGAQQMTVRASTATPSTTLPSRNRGTGSRTAADVVASPDSPVLAPVTGRVLRVGSYALYCRYPDHYVVIEPDERPGWEVKMLHFEGLQVSAGERVEAHRSVLGTRPRALPFESQVDRFSQDRNWPHVHVEVIDPAVPDRPGPGC